MAALRGLLKLDKKTTPSASNQPPVPSPSAPQTSTSPQQQTPTANNSPHDGVLVVRVLQGRDLPASSTALQLPYLVIEFDKNEMVVEASGGVPSRPVWKQKAAFDVSRGADVVVSVWQRGEQGADETFLGMVVLQPHFNDETMEQWLPLVCSNRTDTMQGSLLINVHYERNTTQKSVAIESFDLLKVIGKGSFGKVMQVRKIDTGRIYAMKIIRKANIVQRDEVEHTLAERNVLAQINNPFLVNLKFSFQNIEKLYLVLAFVNGGELFFHLQNEGQFEESRAKFYCAELLCALEHLHEYNIIYRDLKPENILLDSNGHIALCDFGLCKRMGDGKDDKTNTFCGTPEYLAPELLIGQGYNKTVDWWTLGVLLYEMITGLPPFYSENTNEMYQKILYDPLVFPDHVSPDAESLLRGVLLLNRDPQARLGAEGAQAIRSHPFFSELDWQKLKEKKIQPPFKPHVSSDRDTSNFDEEFTKEVPQDSVVDDSHLSETVQQRFAGFTYNPEAAALKEEDD